MTIKKWYAIYTKSRHEKKTTERLKEKGIEVYLPLVKTLKEWSDRKKKVELPLISCYVFVRVSDTEFYQALKTPGVVRYVTSNGKASEIPESQINAMKIAVNGKMNITVTNTNISKGQKVRINSGPFSGFTGKFIARKKKSIFIINLESISYTLQVETDASTVEKV